MSWEAVIGLEVHTQLLTQSKIFSGSSSAYGAAPNTQACAIDLGLPGVLPVLNQKAVEMAIKLGLAIHATVAEFSEFSRKNYFYPDLPKGYQITQFEYPIIKTGYLDIEWDNQSKRVGITRAHLEEDAGKSLHEDFAGMSGIDLNRAGNTLLEIVSEPDIRSAKEAVAYLKTLHTLVCYLGICDGNMQEGSFRCDANVSIRKLGTEKFGTRSEIKNINSFRFVEKAIDYEIARHIAVVESGGIILQETRLFDPDRNETRSLRSKEDAHDYRYFPEPDLFPVLLSPDYIEMIKKTLPELPEAKKKRFQEQYQLSAYDAQVLTSTKPLADFYEEIVNQNIDPKLAANWLMGDIASALNKAQIEIQNAPLTALQIAGLLKRIEDKTLSGKTAKETFEKMWQTREDADVIIESHGMHQITDATAIAKTIDDVLRQNPTQIADYLAGKDKLIGFFVGQVMKVMGGKADPTQLNILLKNKLEEKR